MDAEVNKAREALARLYSEIGFDEAEREQSDEALLSVLRDGLSMYIDGVSQDLDEIRQRCVDLKQKLLLMYRQIGDPAPLAIVDCAIEPPFRSLEQTLQYEIRELGIVYDQRCERADAAKAEISRLTALLGTKTVSSASESTRSAAESLGAAKESLGAGEAVDLSLGALETAEQRVKDLESERRARAAAASALAARAERLWSALKTPYASRDSKLVLLVNESDKPDDWVGADALSGPEQAVAELVAERTRRRTLITSLADQIGSLCSLMKMSSPLDLSKTVYSPEASFVAGEQDEDLSEDYIDLLQVELSSLETEKKKHMAHFIAQAKTELVRLWDLFFVARSVREQFEQNAGPPDSEEMLCAFQGELARWQELASRPKEDPEKMLYALADDLRNLQEIDKRLKESAKKENKRAGDLVKEGNMRMQLEKKYPALLARLKHSLKEWEKDHSAFTVWGKPLLEEVTELEADLPKDRSRAPRIAAPSRPARLPANGRQPRGPPASAAPRAVPRAVSPAPRGAPSARVVSSALHTAQTAASSRLAGARGLGAHGPGGAGRIPVRPIRDARVGVAVSRPLPGRPERSPVRGPVQSHGIAKSPMKLARAPAKENVTFRQKPQASSTPARLSRPLNLPEQRPDENGLQDTSFQPAEYVEWRKQALETQPARLSDDY